MHICELVVLCALYASSDCCGWAVQECCHQERLQQLVSKRLAPPEYTQVDDMIAEGSSKLYNG